MHARSGYPMVLQTPHELVAPLFDERRPSSGADDASSASASASASSSRPQQPFTNISNASYDSPSQSPLILLGSTSSALLAVTRPSASSPYHALWIIGSTPTKNGIYKSFSPLSLLLSSSVRLERFRITHLACGKKHALILTDCSTVFSFGAGHLGQLGHGDDRSRTEPTAIKFFEQYGGSRESTRGSQQRQVSHSNQRVVDVAAGGGHSAVVLRTFDSATGAASHDFVYAWGFNHAGQCGVGDVASSILEPKIVCFHEATGLKDVGVSERKRIVTAVELGASHSLLLTSDGRVYSFGGGTYGRLGVNGSPPQQQMALASSGNGEQAVRTSAIAMLEEEEGRGNIYDPRQMEMQREMQRCGGNRSPEKPSMTSGSREQTSYHDEYLGITTTAASAAATSTTATSSTLRRPPPPGPPPPGATPRPPPGGTLPRLSSSQVQHGGSSIPTPIRFAAAGTVSAVHHGGVSRAALPQQPPPPPPKVWGLACGDFFSVAMLSAGSNEGSATAETSLYSWGFGHDGQM